MAKLRPLPVEGSSPRPLTVLAHPDLRARGISYHPVHLRRLERDGKFPKRIHLGAGRVGWVESEIDAWIKARIAERDAASAAA